MTATSNDFPAFIDIVSDVVCPWCYIGKRHVEAALARSLVPPADVEITIRWHPFPVEPGSAARRHRPQGVSGGHLAARSERGNYARSVRPAATPGLRSISDGIQRQPNTLMAHALIAYAQASRAAPAPCHRRATVQGLLCRWPLLSAISTMLVAIAAECGLDAEATRAVLSEPPTLEQIAALDASVRRQGITGVPFLIFNQKLALSGAQPPEVMLDAMTKASPNTRKRPPNASAAAPRRCRRR